MSIFLPSKDDFADILSNRIGVVVTADQIDLSPATIPSSEELARYGRNTKVVVTAKEELMIVKGQSPAFYDRLELAPLALINVPGVDIDADSTLEEVLFQFQLHSGTALTVDDVDMLSYIRDPILESVKVTLVAKPTSYGWLGNVVLHLRVRPHITEYFKLTTLSGF